MIQFIKYNLMDICTDILKSTETDDDISGYEIGLGIH